MTTLLTNWWEFALQCARPRAPPCPTNIYDQFRWLHDHPAKSSLLDIYLRNMLVNNEFGVLLLVLSTTKYEHLYDDVLLNMYEHV